VVVQDRTDIGVDAAEDMLLDGSLSWTGESGEKVVGEDNQPGALHIGNGRRTLWQRDGSKVHVQAIIDLHCSVVPPSTQVHFASPLHGGEGASSVLHIFQRSPVFCLRLQAETLALLSAFVGIGAEDMDCPSPSDDAAGLVIVPSAWECLHLPSPL